MRTLGGVKYLKCMSVGCDGSATIVDNQFFPGESFFTLVKARDLRSFEMRFEFESAVRLDSIQQRLADSKIFESNRPWLLLCSS